jgi:four helix bundle protein
MATIKRFEDLECWQAARELTKYVYKLTKKEKFSRDFELVRQVRKSSVSSMGNTAEGFHRNSNKDFMKFLGYSRSSIAETVSHSYVAYDQEYIEDTELEEVKRLADIAWKKINNFISYLNESSKIRTN